MSGPQQGPVPNPSGDSMCLDFFFFTAINFGSIDLSFFLQPTSSSLANSHIKAPVGAGHGGVCASVV